MSVWVRSDRDGEDQESVSGLLDVNRAPNMPRHSARSAIDRALVLGLFFFSGATALAYQLVWSQRFGLIFGATAMATAAVLAAYMFGLGLGAAVMARRAQRILRPVRRYALLEVGIAVSALLVTPALAGVRWLHGALAVPLADLGFALEGLASALFYVASAFVVLALPTALMGATLPLLVRFWVRQRSDPGADPEGDPGADTGSDAGRGVAWLYMINTFGAAAGTVLTGFVLIPSLGLGRTVAITVAVNLAIAAAAWLLVADGRRTSAETSEMPEVPEAVPPETAEEASRGVSGRKGLMLALVFGSGLVGMAWEVYWTRLLTHPLGGSLYAFTIMLASFLVGIALGSAATVAVRWRQRTAWIGFGVAQLGLAFVGFATVRGLGAVSLFEGAAAGGGGVLPSARVLGLVGITLVPGALLLGASFPLAVRALAARVDDLAAASGRAFAWNTLGTITGSVLTGFWLLPKLRYEGTATVLVGVSLVLAVAAFVTADGFVGAGRARIGALVAAAGAITLVVAPIDTPWSLLTHPRSFTGFSADRVAYLGVGRSATVMLVDQGGEKRLLSDGLPESSIQGPGSRAARYAVAHWLALLPSTVRPDAERAMVIGLGAGITAGALPPTVAHVDVAEIEPEVLRANRVFADWRQNDPLADPRLRLIVNDARNALTTRRDRYDLIISQPSHPWTLGAASLFTREFYDLASTRLTPRGVLLQWVALPFLDTDLLRTQVATLRAVFRHVEIVRPPPTGAILLLASQVPIDLEAHAHRLGASHRAAWRAIGIDGPDALLLSHWLDDAATRTLAEGAAVSTDARNLMMIRAPRVRGQRPGQVADAVAHLDAIGPLQRSRQDLYPVRALLAVRAPRRAKVALDAIEDADLRAVGVALHAASLGDRARARSALVSLLARLDLAEITREEALAGLLRIEAGTPEGISPSRTDALAAYPHLDGVARAWQRSRLGDWAGLGALDSTLASVPPVHPIYALAIRLRIVWRQQLGDPAMASEALDLLDAQLSVQPGAEGLLLRARLAVVAEDHDRLFGSLFELAGLIGGRRGNVPLRRFDALLERLVTRDGVGSDPRWASVRAARDRAARARVVPGHGKIASGMEQRAAD